MKNGCHLIAYPDSLGTGLPDLRQALEGPLHKAFAGVHILPFYPSSGDRGFAPETYTRVDPRFGTWRDLEELAAGWEVTADFMVNHISRNSRWYRDFLDRGETSEYRDLFIRYGEFWPQGAPGEGDIEKIYKRKPRPPYLEETLPDGTVEKIWCTFDSEQIDLNLQSEKTWSWMEESIREILRHGIKTLRLDAFAYATKVPGTPCFFQEPLVWEYLQRIRRITEPLGVELLPEVHEHHRYQLALAGRGYRVYDFALPFLTLQAFYDKDGDNLLNWMAKAPENQVTTLDTHDGIGVVDVQDLLTPAAIERTQENLYTEGANIKRIYSSAAYQNLDVYQINCSYYSALGEKDRAYLLARAIQLFAPGIPQIYYMGALAGRNDVAGMEKSRNGRDINRRSYSREQVAAESQRPVVQTLLQLFRFRNTHPAFTGPLKISRDTPARFRMQRRSGEEWAELTVDLAAGHGTLRASRQSGVEIPEI